MSFSVLQSIRNRSDAWQEVCLLVDLLYEDFSHNDAMSLRVASDLLRGSLEELLDRVRQPPLADPSGKAFDDAFSLRQASTSACVVVMPPDLEIGLRLSQIRCELLEAPHKLSESITELGALALSLLVFPSGTYQEEEGHDENRAAPSSLSPFVERSHAIGQSLQNALNEMTSNAALENSSVKGSLERSDSNRRRSPHPSPVVSNKKPQISTKSFAQVLGCLRRAAELRFEMAHASLVGEQSHRIGASVVARPIERKVFACLERSLRQFVDRDTTTQLPLKETHTQRKKLKKPTKRERDVDCAAAVHQEKPTRSISQVASEPKHGIGMDETVVLNQQHRVGEEPGEVATKMEAANDFDVLRFVTETPAQLLSVDSRSMPKLEPPPTPQDAEKPPSPDPIHNDPCVAASAQSVESPKHSNDLSAVGSTGGPDVSSIHDESTIDKSFVLLGQQDTTEGITKRPVVDVDAVTPPASATPQCVQDASFANLSAVADADVNDANRRNPRSLMHIPLAVSSSADVSAEVAETLRILRESRVEQRSYFLSVQHKRYVSSALKGFYIDD